MNPNWLPSSDEGKVVHLMEECGETIQAAAKVLRFGLHKTWKGIRNDERLIEEIEDLCHACNAVIDSIEDEAGGTSRAG